MLKIINKYPTPTKEASDLKEVMGSATIYNII